MNYCGFADRLRPLRRRRRPPSPPPSPSHPHRRRRPRPPRRRRSCRRRLRPCRCRRLSAVGLLAFAVRVAPAVRVAVAARPRRRSRLRRASVLRVAVAASVRVAVSPLPSSVSPSPPPVSLAVAVAAVGLAFAASVRGAVAASAVGFAFAACSVRVAVAAVTIRRTHSLHICKFFLMYTAVPAISGRLKASTLSPKPLSCAPPGTCRRLFGAMAGVKLEPGRSRGRFFQRQVCAPRGDRGAPCDQPFSLNSTGRGIEDSAKMDIWRRMASNFADLPDPFNNPLRLLLLNVHVALRQPSRAICDPSTAVGCPAARSFAVIWLSSERSGRLYACHSAALACAWRACS